MNNKLLQTEAAPSGKRFRVLSLLPAAIDLVLVIALLFGFAYLHHGRIEVGEGEKLVSYRSGYTSILPEDFVTADDGGDAGKFNPDNHFHAKEPEFSVSDNVAYYRDSSCEITISTYPLIKGDAHVADVFIRDITCLETVLANDTYGKGQRETLEDMAARSGAIFSMTGDNYSERYGGTILRNGILYSREADHDVCVLNWDGTVDLYTADEFELPSAMESGAYQIWSCGPILLDEKGKPLGQYNADQYEPCRRAALGYYEPGHYCFVIMDGQVTLDELAENMSALGCKSAYALYGGRLAKMRLYWNGTVISTSEEVTRECSDIIVIKN